MHKNQRFNILTEGQKFGVSTTCQKYNISRTIYYRWLKRYKTRGLDGLEDRVRDFVPVNKTSEDLEKSLLTLFRTYPDYGPKAIKYLMEEMGHPIGESAVFNVMKRHGLTNKKNRLNYAAKRTTQEDFPDLDHVNSGECWLTWMTNYGNLYEYTIMDYRSRIACSRLYAEVSYENFEDLLTAVAIPIADSLKLNVQHLCYYPDWVLSVRTRQKLLTGISKIFTDNGYEVQNHLIPIEVSSGNIDPIRNAFTEGRLTYLLPHMTEGASHQTLKDLYQKEIRAYNLNSQQAYSNLNCTPVAYHYQMTANKPVLPIWAYLERTY